MSVEERRYTDQVLQEVLGNVNASLTKLSTVTDNLMEMLRHMELDSSQTRTHADGMSQLNQKDFEEINRRFKVLEGWRDSTNKYLIGLAISLFLILAGGLFTYLLNHVTFTAAR